MTTFRLLLALAAALAAVPGCRPDDSASAPWRIVDSQIQKQYPDVAPISTDSLAAWLAGPEEARPVLLDARAPAEYDVSHLAGAVRVDTTALEDALLQVDRQRAFVVYCSVGVRSAGVARRLKEAGFLHVSNLEGSIFRWANEGRPLESAGGLPAETVHPFDSAWGRLLKPELRATLP